jgi:elongation factor 2
VLLKRLWGDNFYDPVSKKWKKEPYNDQGDKLKRGFVQFIMEPIIDMHKKIVVQEDLQNVFKKLDTLSL